MPRTRKYANDAERAAAYRARKKAEEREENIGSPEADAALIAALAKAVGAAAQKGFFPAEYLLAGLNAQQAETDDEAARQRKIVEKLAHWLEFEAAQQAVRLRWLNREMGWNRAAEWLRPAPFTEDGYEEMRDAQERAVRFWEDRQKELGEPENWFAQMLEEQERRQREAAHPAQNTPKRDE